MLEQARNFFLNLLFPKSCFLCQREGSYLCQDCQATLEISGFHQISSASKDGDEMKFHRLSSDSEDGEERNALRQYSTENLDDLYFAIDYQKPLIKKLIQSFKYEPFIKELADNLSSLIIEHFQLLEKLPDFTDRVLIPVPLDSNPPTTHTPPPSSPQSEYVLIPVPLDRKKLKWRGFNQAEEIGKELSKFLKISLINDVLVKIKETLPQVELSDEERKENIKGAFSCQNPELIKGRKILLVDDIYTTGSTMAECARVLKTAGAKEIIGIVIARG